MVDTNKLDSIPAFNQQRTCERFGYEYPSHAKQQVSINCSRCRLEGQLAVNDLYTRIKNKGEYLCRSCASLKREEAIHTVDWQGRCASIIGYSAEATKEHYGYSYPTRSAQRVCVICTCGAVVHRTISDIWKNTKPYRCKKCMAKEEFEIRREKMLAAKDEYWSHEENRQKASDLAKTQTYRRETMSRLNQEEEFKSKRRSGYETNINEIKEAQSKASKELWTTRYEEMKEATAQTAPKRAEILKKHMEDPITRSHYSAKGKENWENPEYRKKQNDAWTEDRREQRKQQNKSPEFLAKVSSGMSNTTEEQILNYFFSSLDIKVEKQYVIGPHIFDIYAPQLNLLVEFDGMRWHNADYVSGKALNHLWRDRAKTTYIQNHRPDLTLVRFNENDIYQKKFLETTFQHLIIETDFNFKDVEIRDVDNKEALLFLTLFHYKENQRAAPGLKLGAYWKNKLIGLAVYSSVSRQEIATSMGYKPKEILELSRFCIHPAFHKNNFGSWLLARTREQARSLYPYVRGIATFADTTLDHHGTIYKAAGYTFVSEVPEDYHYQHQTTGLFMHKRTLWGLSKKMSEPEIVYADKHGFKKVWGAKKLKFFFSFE